MKRVVGTLMLVFFGLVAAFAQDSPQSTPEFKRNKQVFEMASLFNDAAVARTALYNMIAIDSKNPALLDSLALLYYEFQNYSSAAIVTQAALRANPGNPLMLELSAICYESLGLPDTVRDALYEAKQPFDTLQNGFSSTTGEALRGSKHVSRYSAGKAGIEGDQDRVS
jgi:tetratricopeptide (TPR) repeat protein